MDHKRIVVFHHNDNDGKAAAAVIYRWFLDHGVEIKDFISVNYNDSIPTADRIQEGDNVYIVDYSFTEDTATNLIQISKKAGSLRWYDHHKTSLDIYDVIKKSGICYDCIVDMDRSGALIVYDVLKDRGCWKDGSKVNTYKSSMKPIIDLVDDYDRWVHSNPNSMLFNIGSQMQDTSPTSDIWISDPEKIIENGKLLKEYNTKKNNQLTKSNGFGIKINGHMCIVLNTPESSSQVFADYFKATGFGIRFVFDGRNFSYSIYSTLQDIDCSKIAQHFNPKGGGHKGAAGFVSDKLEFFADTDYNIEMI